MDTDEKKRLDDAALAAWDVTGERSQAAARERMSQARVRAIVGVVVGTVVAIWLFSSGHRIGAIVPGVVAAALLVTLVALPADVLVRVAGLLDRFGEIIGRAAAWLFLTPVYLLVVFPFGLLRRARGHDALDRRGPQRESYWKKHAGRGSSERTF